MIFEQLFALKTACRRVMRCDAYRLQKRVNDLQTKLKNGQLLDTHIIEQLSTDIENSLKRREFRTAHLPIPEFPDDLPVSERRQDLATTIAHNQVVIVAGETGSGKTTQLPKICLTLGRGTAGVIGCTQPRRIATRTVAARVAHELNSPLGQVVGYKIRFSDRLSPDTYVKFMTDGILLAETQTDRFLEQYDTLIIDEAHERSLNIDFLLGYLKQLLPKRPDLKVIITSATIDTQRFSQHFFDAPIIEVSGRTYPVETRYRPLSTEDEDEQDRDIQQAIVDAVDEITLYDRHSDILIFLSGERDIRDTAETLRKHKLLHTEILPLYSRLSSAEQDRVFNPNVLRRIILATNVAETSLTVPRIKAVIDTGLARMSRYSIRSKVQRLPVEKISRSSADQRKGRCGRISPGLCIRLYSQEDYQQRPEFTDPEILRASLASVILQMLFLRLGDIEEFPFVDPPSQKMINDGFTLLNELEAVDSKRRLTDIGRQLAKLPIDPRIGRMILAAKQESCLYEVLIIASALSIQDPRERPMDNQQAADLAQIQFVDTRSDFLGFLKLWEFLHEKAKHLSKNKLRQLCHEHFISYLRLLEWQDIHYQLSTLVKESGWLINEPRPLFSLPETEFTPIYEAIHRALLAGLLGNIGTKTKEEPYLGTRNTKLHLFPGSGLFKKQPKWIMAAELVETSKLYARCVAKIEPEWVEKIAGSLCQYSYFEPHWEKTTAQVAAFEKVTLYGLTIVPKRKVNYGPLDPVQAREIFIRNALVEGEYHCNFAFFQHNRELFNEIQVLEHKARRQNILVDDHQIFTFYDARIPQGIYSGKTFEKWLNTAQQENPQLLFLNREDLMRTDGDYVTIQSFPDYILLNQAKLPLTYHFEPGHVRDGVTVDLPLALLNQISPQPFEWLVPGLLVEKITALLRNLPKTVRKQFVPIPETAQAVLDTVKGLEVTFREGGSFLEYPKQSIYQVLNTYCQRRLGQPLPEDIWKTDEFPPYLLMNFCLLDQHLQFLDMSRDLTTLQMKWGTQATETCQKKVAQNSGLERDKLLTWDFDKLPDSVQLILNEVPLQGFPTLVDQKTHVALRILDNQEAATESFYTGLRRLFWLNLPIKRLFKQMPINHKLCLQYMRVGDCEVLKEELLTAVIETAFLYKPLPRCRAEFEQRLGEGQRRMMTIANEYANTLRDILEAYFSAIQQLDKTRNPPADVQQQLETMVYAGFIQRIPLTQLKQLPRYLKAICLRLERREHDPNKDLRKAAQIELLWQGYLAYSIKGNREKLSILEEFRWMLEEFRVSLFAQELKTPFPVSIQKLQEVWNTLILKG